MKNEEKPVCLLVFQNTDIFNTVAFQLMYKKNHGFMLKTAQIVFTDSTVYSDIH